MGSVKERYLQYEKAGDQYLGRVVSGLDVNDISFAVSPPFFDNADGDERENILSLIKDYMVGGHYMTGDMYYLFYFCFASICFHFDFLKEVLHEKKQAPCITFLYSHSS